MTFNPLSGRSCTCSLHSSAFFFSFFLSACVQVPITPEGWASLLVSVNVSSFYGFIVITAPGLLPSVPWVPWVPCTETPRKWSRSAACVNIMSSSCLSQLWEFADAIFFSCLFYFLPPPPNPPPSVSARFVSSPGSQVSKHVCEVLMAFYDISFTHF